MSICSTIIDTLSTYHYPNADGVRNRFISFLENYLKNDIKRKIVKDGLYDRFKSNISCIKALKIGVLTENVNGDTFAKVFYEAFRNPIIHNSSILSYGGYIFNQKFLFRGKFWQDTKKRYRFELSINPVILLELIEAYIDDYIIQLKDPKNRKIRSNFKKKFRFDFGLTELPSFSIKV